MYPWARRAVVLSLTLLGCACGSPRYEVHRLPARELTWRRCTPGADGEQRLTSSCPEVFALAAGADRGPDDGDHVVADLPSSSVLAGPVALVIDTLTYRPPQPGAKLGDVVVAMHRRAPRQGLRSGRRGLATLHAGSARRVVRRFDALPSTVTVPLPRRHGERRAAWSVSAWTGARSSERVEIVLPSVPPQARLAFSYAVAAPGTEPGSPGITFAVETSDGTQLWSGRVADGPRHGEAWHDATIPLPRTDGSLVLRLVATVDGGATSFPLWGEPALLVPASPRVATAPNVLLVSLDTLRADALALAGRNPPIMPVLDRFAAASVGFRQAFATFPSTTGSHMTMMTSLHPCAHGVVMLNTTLSPAATTLAEVFASAGWATAAVTEDALIKGDVGFARGFDRYVDQSPYRKPLGIFGHGIARALGWIDAGADRPFFLFLHTYQSHEPYKVPRHLAPLVERADAGDRFGRLRAEYEAAVRHTDELLDHLLRGLRERGLLDTTLVVITSDHGQAFGEHGVHGHGSDVFVEQLAVPLVFHHPMLGMGGRLVDTPVSLVDLAPTILALVGLDPPPSFEGRSLAPLLRGDDGANPSPVFSQNLWGKRRTAYRDADHAWIEGRAGTTVYDRRRDPGERNPLFVARQPSLLYAGRQAITGFAAKCAETAAALATSAAEPAAPIDAATRDALRALGYAE